MENSAGPDQTSPNFRTSPGPGPKKSGQSDLRIEN